MTPIALLSTSARPSAGTASGRPFAWTALGLALLAAILAGWAPLGLSIVTVFLFAGPHNWAETRYFLSRLPARWGRLRGFFLLSFGGVVGLTASFAALPELARICGCDEDGWLLATAVWNTLLLLWVTSLAVLRSRQNPRRNWSWMLPLAGLLLAVNWLMPRAWDLGLIYLHPLVALWILDRELYRSRPAWRPVYHACLACLPALLAVLWWRLADAPSLQGDDVLSLRIAQHAGADVLQGVSTHLLVATHTFLETLHYGVWLLAIPLVGWGNSPRGVANTPLGRRGPAWPRRLRLLLAAGGMLVVLLWACFLADYPATRDVYFTVALAHVLAEVPLLLRLL